MELSKVIGLASLLFLCFSGVASATAIQHNDCGDGGSTCDTPFSQTLTTTDINTYNYLSSWSFDAVTAPSLAISSATLKVQTNASGNWWDNLYAGSNSFPYITYVGHLDGGIDVFSLSSSLFDEVMSGLSLGATFDSKSEYASWSQLIVDGTYCPPVSQVPVPAALWLFAPALMGFTALRKRAKKA